MNELINKLSKSVKARVGIKEDDTTQDNLIVEEVEDLVIEVLEYCSLKELPKSLEPFVKRKVVEYIRSGVTGITGEWDEQVKSISRGDTKMDMLTEKERLSVRDIEILEKFRPNKVIVR